MAPSGLNVPPDQDQYILVVDGKPAGPFSVEELRAKNIKSGDFVKTPQMDDYKEAHELAALRELFGFAKRALPIQYFGSFDQRAIASVIDWLIVLGVFVGIAIAVAIIASVVFTSNEKSGQILTAVISFGVMALTPVGKLIYHVKMETSDKQATYGKQLMHVRVTDLMGAPIDRSKAVARNLAKLLSTAPFFLGYLTCFFNKKQQCLHDMVADTLVIKDRL
ncbi:RDD family protein [Mucilaginibacter sp.]|uniref:RDD family protein n=1 Tax=Mucilaginibacter sp. TaxID=1882438 RepID=UPI0035BC09B1